jgi:hypothetical protein
MLQLPFSFLRLFALLCVLFLTACGGGSGGGGDTGSGDGGGDGSGDGSGGGDGGGDVEPRAAVTYDANGFKVDDQYRLLRGGTIQYFRIPESDWEERLKRFKAGGFNTVDLYVPWNIVEAVEGTFDFTTPDLARFLDLCKELGLFVYFRPGPYITNEMNGGGIPSWLSANSTKKAIAEDGKPNLRTHDADYLVYVKRYLSAVNEFIKPWLRSNGGPIILYSLENEYSWFEIFFLADKSFIYEGGPERGVFQATPTTPYFTAMRDYVLADGIDVPLTSCPGNGTTDGMGGVAGIVPMPNMYDGLGGERPELVSWDLLNDMQIDSQNRHNGIYTQMPSGTTETDRDPVKIKRLIMGGLDGTFSFNLFGGSQPGRLNAVVMNARSREGVIDTSDFDNFLRTGSLSPEIGYFHNVIDFNGAVSPAGQFRDSYWDFRRNNLLFDAFETEIASAGRAKRSGTFTGAEAGLTIANTVLGAVGKNDELAHFWLDAGASGRFLNVVNETESDQTIATNGIQSDDVTFPRFSAMTVPVCEGCFSKTNAVILPVEVPIDQVGTLKYSTAEVIGNRAFNGESLLVVHGKAGTTGELAIATGAGTASLDFNDAGFVVRERISGSLVVTTAFNGYQVMRVTLPGGRKLRILSLETSEAGRLWYLTTSLGDVVVGGPDYVDASAITTAEGELQLPYARDDRARDLFVMLPAGRRSVETGLAVEQGFDAARGTAVYARPAASSPPVLTVGLQGGKTLDDTAEAEPDFDDSAWETWTGEPRSLDSLGIYAGHAWYRTEFDLATVPSSENATLFVEHASDFVGIYVNGHYLTQVAPMGTEIDSNNANTNYQFPSLAPWLRVGRNVIAFRTEVWGHGSFMFPRGKLLGFGGQVPAVGFDSVKGLYGEAWVGGETGASRVALTQWKVRAVLNGERSGYAGDAVNESTWSSASFPLALSKGQILWYRTRFDASALPDPSQWLAPAVLSLAGERVKATLFLNGQIVGRWLSDDGNGTDGWLRHGFWGRGINNMWMNTLPGHFPVAATTLRPTGTDNQLAIAFEDASRDDDASAGVVTSLALEYSREVRKTAGDGSTSQVSTPLAWTRLGIQAP